RAFVRGTRGTYRGTGSRRGIARVRLGARWPWERRGTERRGTLSAPQTREARPYARSPPRDVSRRTPPAGRRRVPRRRPRGGGFRLAYHRPIAVRKTPRCPLFLTSPRVKYLRAEGLSTERPGPGGPGGLPRIGFDPVSPGPFGAIEGFVGVGDEALRG